MLETVTSAFGTDFMLVKAGRKKGYPVCSGGLFGFSMRCFCASEALPRGVAAFILSVCKETCILCVVFSAWCTISILISFVTLFWYYTRHYSLFLGVMAVSWRYTSKWVLHTVLHLV